MPLKPHCVECQCVVGLQCRRYMQDIMVYWDSGRGKHTSVPHFASRSSCVQPMKGSFVSTTWSCSCWPCAAARLVKPPAKASAVSVDLMLVVCKECYVSKVKPLRLATV
jgi:hypothetical protein